MSSDDDRRHFSETNSGNIVDDGIDRHKMYWRASYTGRVRARNCAYRVIAFFAAVAIFSSTALSQSRVALTETQSKAELHAVLLEARTAIIQVVEHDSSTFYTSIAEDIQELVDLSRGLDDRDFVRYLQEHLKEDYAEGIRHALDPAEIRQDFAKRIAALPGSRP
jgi:hypothetical protein